MCKTYCKQYTTKFNYDHFATEVYVLKDTIVEKNKCWDYVKIHFYCNKIFQIKEKKGVHLFLDASPIVHFSLTLKMCNFHTNQGLPAGILLVWTSWERTSFRRIIFMRTFISLEFIMYPNHLRNFIVKLYTKRIEYDDI